MDFRCRQFSALALLATAAVALGADIKDKSEFKPSKDEQAILDLTNEARAKEKLPPLKPNATLFEAARAHSANMAKLGELNHVLEGKNPQDRITEAGYRAGYSGENIAFTGGRRPSPKEAVKMWLNSPPHRANILSDKFDEIGIGIARAAGGQVYYTQVFGAPRKRR